MTKTEHFPATVEARSHGNRAHMRRKLSPMAYVELGQDNGGILLNLSEGGFAVQSALALTSREFPELRFQVPALRGWLTASGRIVWMSDSKKEAGIQFTQLPAEAITEIQKWVSAEGTSEERSTGRSPLARERAPVTPPGTVATTRTSMASVLPEPPQNRKQIFEPPYRAAEPPPQSPVAQEEHYGVAREALGRTIPTEPIGVAIAEPPPQDFHFTDYSMFAAVPEKDITWVQPRTRSWRGAVLGMLLAALFFALGATVGRGTVDRWFTYLGGWVQSQDAGPVLKVTPPPAPEQLGGTDNSNATEEKSDEQTDTESSTDPAADSGAAANSEPAINKPSSPKPESPKTEPSRTGSLQQEAIAAAAARSGNMSGAVERSGNMSGAVERRAKHSADTTEPSRPENEHSILVNAPEPGSSPFFVNLRTEAVSASGAIAISARRTLEILPRSSSAGSGLERVVVGKLILHSEPFYPAEARSRGIEGSVELRARVGRTGQVVSVTPVSGPWMLFAPAVAAVREWRYEPTYVNGDPAETLADITIVFRLR